MQNTPRSMQGVSVLGLLICFDVSVELFKQRIHIHTVHRTSLLQGLAASGRTAQAMHSDFQEIRSGGAINIQDITYNGVLGDLCHDDFLLRQGSIYYTAFSLRFQPFFHGFGYEANRGHRTGSQAHQ